MMIPGEDFGKSLQEMVMEKVKDYHYPGLL